MRGKLRNLRKLAHSFDRKTTKFGDTVTADHVSFTEAGGIYGLYGATIGLVVKDIHTSFIEIFTRPTPRQPIKCLCRYNILLATRE